ncbi:MAG: LysR family transcriptional regulator [Clostridia bacterium]|nr:LysR family transcriptional regulator [Clostridia bacterium]
MEAAATYAYQVYQSGSFTKAAQILYISQPSLSAAISRLEQNLGFRIFDRSTIPCSLTPEGRIYIKSLEEILESENNMRRRIKEISDKSTRRLTIGGASFAAYLVLSKACEQFHRNYPEINVTLDIGNIGSSLVLHEKLDRNEIDALICYEVVSPEYIAEPIFEERVVIAMHKSLPGAERIRHLALTGEEILTKSYDPAREIEDMSLFRDIEFLEYPPKSASDQRMSRLLGSYRPSHYKIHNARHSEMHYNLMCVGIGAAMTSTLAIEQKPYNENILFFIPKSHDSYRKIFFTYRAGSGNEPLIKRFLEVAKRIYTTP